MTFLRLLTLLAFAVFAGLSPAAAQSVDPPPAPEVPAEQGRQTLEDILARQAAHADPRIGRDPASAEAIAAGITNQLGPLGGASDPVLWEGLRFGSAEVKVSAGGDTARVLIQDRGMWWQEFRKGPLAQYGGGLLLATIGALALFFLIRGRIKISHGISGITILRFTAIERFAHWLLAGSFIVLGLTGLFQLFGRLYIIPLIGKDAFAPMAQAGKWLHNNLSWAFMAALVMVFVFWVIHNIPNRTDLVWFAKGGGIIGKGHPPAKKFNGGQKIIFWSVIVLGASISVSGLSLLFPFQLPMFAKTFAILNDIGVPGWLGMESFPTQLTPHAEMQFAQLWHAIVAFVLMAIIIAHIYIGTVGMQGAYAAMGSGQVDLNWAKEHHSLWVEEVEAKKGQAGGGAATPAE